MHGIHRPSTSFKLLPLAILSAFPGQLRSEEPVITLSRPASAQEIESRIAELAHPIYERRLFATRRLCAIGLMARDALRAAAESDNVETRLRARSILSALDRILFAGVDIELAATKKEFAWDESVDLMITLTNRSDFPARIPFELHASDRSRLTGDPRQVADMIDAAEWLTVTHEPDQTLSLRVDDISVDRAIAQVVHGRVDHPPTSILEPGQRVTLTIHAMNRGWARYPLLDQGQYQFTFDYVPQWQDAVLMAEKIGQVTSNVLELLVTKPAPETVSRRGAEASLNLALEDDESSTGTSEPPHPLPTAAGSANKTKSCATCPSPRHPPRVGRDSNGIGSHRWPRAPRPI